MRKSDEAALLLRLGLAPGQIRRRQSVTLQTILSYLDQGVGRGEIRRSDIFFSVPGATRQAVLEHLNQAGEENDAERAPEAWRICKELTASGIEVDPDDVEVILRYRDERYAFGDMYDDLRTIELRLHALIREALKSAHGDGELGWWRKAVPLPVRQKCVARREEDPEPVSDPYVYCDLIDLRTLLEKQWTAISPHLSKDARSDKKQLCREIEELNRIRRLVMHPVRGVMPTESEFEFVRSVKRKLGFLRKGESLIDELMELASESSDVPHPM